METCLNDRQPFRIAKKEDVETAKNTADAAQNKANEAAESAKKANENIGKLSDNIGTEAESESEDGTVWGKLKSLSDDADAHHRTCLH